MRKPIKNSGKEVQQLKIVCEIICKTVCMFSACAVSQLYNQKGEIEEENCVSCSNWEGEQEMCIKELPQSEDPGRFSRLLSFGWLLLYGPSV